MQIAFWSDEPWQSGIVGNMVGISYMLSSMYAYQGLIMQTKFACPDFDYALIPETRRVQVKEDFSYYRETGLDAVLSEAALHVQKSDSIKEHSIEIKKHKLYYLPGTYKTNKEVYEHNFYTSMERLLKAVNEFGDLVFLDVSGDKGILNKRLLEKSDMVIVNMSQNPAGIRRFFETNPSFIQKSVFLIGQYDADSKHHINNIRRRFHLSKEEMEAIPYNVNFLDSLSEGKAISFLEQNLECSKKDYNYSFIKGLMDTAAMIAARVKAYEKAV